MSPSAPEVGVVMDPVAGYARRRNTWRQASWHSWSGTELPPALLKECAILSATPHTSPWAAGQHTQGQPEHLYKVHICRLLQAVHREKA